MRHRKGTAGVFPPGGDRREQGDVSVLFVFLVLSMLVLGALVLVGLLLSALRGTRDISASAQAFYAADTAIEVGTDAYNWSPDRQNPVCLRTNGTLPGIAANYALDVHGATSSGWANCVTLEQVLSGQAALCMEGTGTTRAGGVRRRVTNDSYTSGTTFTCR